MFDNFRKEVRKGILVILASVVVFGVSFYFFSKSLNSVTNDIVSDRLLIAKNSGVLENLAELKRGDQEAVHYQKAMEKLLVPKDQLLQFPGWLDGLARVRQVGLNFSFSGAEVAPQENYPGYINFSLDMTGSINALTSFLEDIELQPTRFLANLDSFEVTKSDSGYRITSSGKVFFKL